MVRNTAREIAIHLSYELSFTDKPVEELLDERLTPESFAALAEEDPLYQETPNAKQADYIRRLVRGVADHAPELDGYIAKYAKGWNFARIPLPAAIACPLTEAMQSPTSTVPLPFSIQRYTLNVFV